MLTTVLQAIGLATNTNKLSGPAGGLTQADNVVIDRKDVIEGRRGFGRVGNTFAFAGSGDNLFSFQNKMIATNGSTLAYDANGNGSNPLWTSYSGTYLPPTGAAKIHGVEAINKNFYFTTSNGVYKSDLVTATPYAAGGPKALDGTGVTDGAGAGWFANTSNVAYQVVWGYTDTNSNLILGDPSQLINVTNNTGAAQNVNLTFTVPSGLTVSYFWQLYRSAQTNSLSIIAGSAFQLVAQANLTAGQITALQVTYSDLTPDSLKGAYLYSDTTQQGPLQTNDPPPLALDVCTWKGMMFYANCQSKQRVYATMISVGAPNGVQVADTFVIKSGATTLTYTGNAAQNVVTHLFKVDTSSTAAANIDATARNLVACINQDATNSLVYAYYISGAAQLPGQILLEERAIGGVAFNLTSSRGGAYQPVIPSSGTTYISTNQNYPNGVYVSKINQPEAVPLVNLYPVGAGDQAIYRIFALTDAVYALKADGVYRGTGDTPSNLSFTVAYPDTIVTAPESGAILNNSIYAYTNQGIVTINQSEPQLISFPIEDQLVQIQTYANFATASYGVSYPSDRKYIFSTVTSSTDTSATQEWVYNYITQAWTRWNKNFSCGFMNPVDKKLYWGSVSPAFAYQERKAYTVMDYADDSFAVNIENVSGTTLTLTSTANCVVGMSLAQTTTNVNYPIASIITAVTDATHIVVAASIQWTLGAANVYTSINCTVAYAPATGGFPLYLKHWGTINFELESLTAAQITGQVTSDLSNYLESFSLVPNLPGFGEVPFGTEVFGGLSFSPQPLRALVPQNKARAHWINLLLNHNQALAKFVLNGASAEYDITSTRMR